MDQLLQMIQSADPTDNQSDSAELLQLEGEVNLGFEKNEGNVNEKSTKAGAVCLGKRGLLLSTDVFFFLQVPVIRWAPSSTRSWKI